MAKAGGNLLNTYVADYVVFDLETTGISPKTDEVVEISAVKVEHGKVTDEFSTLVNPKRRIPYGASRVNGITDDMVAEAPFFEQVLEEFLEFIKGFVLVGHNIARFDMNFLYRDVEKYFERSLPNDYIDTLQMARRELPDLEHHRLTYVKRPGWYFRIRTTRSSVRWSKKMSDSDRKTWEYRPRRSGRELKRVSKVSACGNIAKILQTNFPADKNSVWRSPAWLQCIRNASFWMSRPQCWIRTAEKK